MNRRRHLTLQQHTESGRKLKLVRDEITIFRSQLYGYLPNSDPAFRKVQRIMNLVTEISFKLEARMFAQHGDEGDLGIYFGPRERDDRSN
jgi:hypothetical protein